MAKRSSIPNDRLPDGPPPDAPATEGSPDDGTEGTLVGDGTAVSESGGVGRLKYAGVGPPRSPAQGAKARLTGADVTSLGSLEAEIMGVLWEIGRPASGMEVMEASLYKRRAQGEEPVSFATIATTLRRLAEKGVLLSEKHQSRTPIYSPLVGREEMAARILNNVSVTLLGRPLLGLLPRLLGGPPAKGAESQEEVRRLLRALEEIADDPDAAPEGP